ncbi:hypothetical protein C8J57DRAFT_1292640 [Mycena rebaudengoi]|nr:hypothetical protein C8J57DRAFT_1292640 [Mycena rebaudengoi]
MYSWPTNNTVDRPSTLHRHGKAKGKDETQVNYPVLGQGEIAAATLLEEKGRFEWTSIIGNSSQHAQIKAGKSTIVFPATRPPPLHIPQTTILQRAEQGANFLRTYVPDVDIAAELIREEITADANVMRNFEAFDPYVGNQLEIVACYGAPTEQSAFLAFPIGELSRDLNISPLLFSKEGRTVLKPTAQAIYTFDTPIQQISASKPNNENRKHASHLAVRTFGATSLLEFKTTGPASNPISHLNEVGTIMSSDTGGRQLVDIKIDVSLDVVMVNDRGSVYKTDITTGPKSARLVHEDEPHSSGLFWRLELCEVGNVCLLMSQFALKELDLRANNVSLGLHSALGTEVLTSVEDYQVDQMIRLCSTDQVIWIDRRNTARPLLAFKHGRAFDRSLEAKTISLHDGYLTTLTSRKNGILTIYDVARSQGSLIRARTPPYSLVASSGGGIQKGHAFLRHPLDVPESPITFFRISQVGSLHGFNLAATDIGPTLFSWSEDVQRLDRESAQLREDLVRPLGSHDLTVVDMSSAYDQIFHGQDQKNKMDEEDAAESLYDLVEKAPSYWQDLNDPVVHMLTTYDILFRSGDEPNRSTRADFLSDSAINSVRGHRALLQGRLSTDILKKDASWDHDITDTIRKFDPDISSDPRVVAERLRRFDLRPDSARSLQSVKRECDAREQLSLDLALSRHIYSPHPFSADEDPSSKLETMTKTLSLNGVPPPVSFGFLRPVSKHTTDDLPEGDGDETIPLGVRLLLRDWDVGTDFRNFVYNDPYDSELEEPTPIRKKRPSPKARPEERPVEPHRPPLVVASISIVPSNQSNVRRPFISQDTNFHRPTMYGSQPVAPTTQLEEATQDFRAGTQIVPGVYGGRPSAKKKAVKKRLGGF